MERLRALIAKELRELLRERLVLIGMIVMPALIMAFMGGLQGIALKKTVEQAAQPLKIAVSFTEPPTPEDRAFARALAGILNATFFDDTLNESPVSLLSRGYNAVVLLPRGAAANFTAGLPVSVDIYVSLPSPSPMASALASRVEESLSAALRVMVAEEIRRILPQASPSFLVSPAETHTVVVVWGKEIPSERYTSYMLSLYGVPVALLILISSAMQVGAISMGLEREAKTLEMLLASPLTPSDLVLSKIISVLLVALIGAASFSAGFLVYYYSLKEAFAAAAGTDTPAMGVSLTALGAVSILVTLVMDLYIAAVLGLILGLGAEDVRGAQMVANYFGFLLLIPYIVVFFGYVPGLHSLGAILLLDPLYPPLLATLGAHFGRGGLALTALGVQAVHLVVWTLVALKLLEPERLVAGIPIRRLLAKRGLGPRGLRG